MEKIRRFKTSSHHIGMLKAILDGYEFLAFLSVIDGSRGLIELSYSAMVEDTLVSVLESLRSQGIVLEEVAGA